MLVSLFGAPIWWQSEWVQEMRQLTKSTCLVLFIPMEISFLRYYDTWELKGNAKIWVLGHFENSRVSSCHAELDQILNCFICKTKQYIDMKLFLKIYLCTALNILLEQLCGALSLRFRILMTSHKNQKYTRVAIFSEVENNSYTVL